MSDVLLLAGPPAVGHNTVAEALARRMSRCSVLDVDDFRAMQRGPGLAPGSGHAFDEAYALAVAAACDTARRFVAHGPVVVVDVCPPETLSWWRDGLHGVRVQTVLLLADADVLIARDTARARHADASAQDRNAWQNRIRMLHAQLEDAAELYDLVLRTDELSPSAAAALLHTSLGGAK